MSESTVRGRRGRLAGLLAGALSVVVLAGCVPGLPGAPRTTGATSPSSSTSSAAPSSASSPAKAPTPTRQPTQTQDPTRPVSPDRQVGPLPFVKLPGMVDAPAGKGLERYTSQKVDWQPCDGSLECAKVLAPMDYTNPDGVAITLNVKRKKATGTDRIGSLFVNPGGPGAGGTEMVGQERWEGVQDRYDIVGWDPRGTGESTPVACYANADEAARATDAQTAVDSSPDDETEYEKLVSSSKAFADTCAKYSGSYLRFVTTKDVIQDMDLLRQLVGDEKLHYVGYSYGTYLGAMYAHYFPEKVGHLVLDSAANITDDQSIPQSEGFDRALGLFAEWAGKRNRIGGSKDEVIKKLTEFVDKLDSQPVKVGDRELTQSLAVTGIITPLYGTEGEWAILERAISDAYGGNGGSLLRMADLMNDRGRDGKYGQSYFSFPVMLCADSEDDGLAAAKALWKRDQAKAPFFGKYFGPAVTCETWRVPPPPHVKLTAPTAAPIVVVGSTGDPATPYEYAGWMADQLGSGTLLTFDGPGHGTYGGTNGCIDNAVNAYLKENKVPEKGAVCRQ